MQLSKIHQPFQKRRHTLYNNLQEGLDFLLLSPLQEKNPQLLPPAFRLQFPNDQSLLAITETNHGVERGQAAAFFSP